MEINSLIATVSAAKYWALFVLFLIEGPIVNFVASMVSATGALNIWIVAPLAILGNVAGDLLHYFLGTRISNIKFKDKLSKVKNKSRFEYLERLLTTHFYKALFVIKVIPAFSSIGLLYVGKKRLSFKKFIWGSVSISIVLGLFISFLGYFVFESATNFLFYFDIYQKIALIVALIIAFIFLMWYFREYIISFFFKKRIEQRDYNENSCFM